MKPNAPYRDEDVASMSRWLVKHGMRAATSIKGDFTMWRKLAPESFLPELQPERNV